MNNINANNTTTKQNDLEHTFLDAENKFVQLDALITALNHEAVSEKISVNTSNLINLATSLMDEFRTLFAALTTEIN